MPETCGEPHPEHPEVTCEKPRPCYALHWNIAHQMDWDGEPPPPPPPPPKTRKAQAAGIANGIPAAPTTGPPDLSMRAKPVPDWD
jgi:hypothetical protein